MESTLKDQIIAKINSRIDKITTDRVAVRNYSDIKSKLVSSMYLFYHPIYRRNNIEYLNEEEDTDFLVFEDNLVYVDYSDNLFTFHKIDEEEKLVKVDLDNNTILDNDENQEDDLSEEIISKTDYITFNYFPICKSHTNLTVCFEQRYPQLLSNEFILQAIQIFDIANDNSSLKLGYDSLGAGCIINHLHFELLFLDELGISMLPIELSIATPIFTTNFENLDPNEISMFDENIEIIISQINYMLKGWKISFKTIGNPSFAIDAAGNHQNSLANAVNMIVSHLIDMSIPHNIIISEGGKVFYILPRNFNEDKSNLEFNTNWLDLSGMVTARSQEFFDNAESKINQFFEYVSTHLTLNDASYLEINENLLKKFQSLYKVNIKPNEY